MDKIAGLDFRSTLAPWSYYRNLYAQIPSNIQKKLSPAYRSYDPTILDVPAGHYGGRGFIYRNRVAVSYTHLDVYKRQRPRAWWWVTAQ